MLQSIRNVVTGWVAVILFVLLIIPFAFWGIDSYFGVTAVNAAKVNDAEVTLVEYQRAYQTVRQQWQNISPAMAEQAEFIKQQTLDSLVDRLLLLGLKNDLGLKVNDAQVRTAINEIPVFRNPEGFDLVAYQNYLATQGYTPARFEAQIREDISLQQIQAGLMGTLIVPKVDAVRLAVLQGQTRDFRYAVLSHDTLAQGIEVSDSEIDTYYQQHAQEFMLPEQVRLAYIHLSSEEIARGLSVDEEALRAYFEGTKQNYSIAERRKVRQILVYTDQDNSQRAGEIAAEIRALVSSGTTFDDVKDRYTDNTEVTVEVSDFGFINKGVLDTAVDEAVFALDKGAISEPIQTDYGYQIVTVDDITGGTSAAFEDVRAEVELDYRREQAQKRFFELYDELAVLTYEHPDTLEVASETLGLPVNESSLISRDGAGELILNDPRVLSAAFSEEVLTNGNNSDLLEVNEDDVLVIRVMEHNQAQKRPLAEVRDRVVAGLKAEKATEKARTLGEEIRQKLAQDATPEAITTDYNAQWVKQTAIKRDYTGIDREILQLAFKGQASANGPAIDGVSLPSGDYAIVLLDAVHDVNAESIAATEIQATSSYLRQSMASRSLSRIIEDLRKHADIEIYDINL